MPKSRFHFHLKKTAQFDTSLHSALPLRRKLVQIHFLNVVTFSTQECLGTSTNLSILMLCIDALLVILDISIVLVSPL